jgi:hypothetical protein
VRIDVDAQTQNVGAKDGAGVGGQEGDYHA